MLDLSQDRIVLARLRSLLSEADSLVGRLSSAPVTPAKVAGTPLHSPPRSGGSTSFPLSPSERPSLQAGLSPSVPTPPGGSSEDTPARRHSHRVLRSSGVSEGSPSPQHATASPADSSTPLSGASRAASFKAISRTHSRHAIDKIKDKYLGKYAQRKASFRRTPSNLSLMARPATAADALDAAMGMHRRRRGTGDHSGLGPGLGLDRDTDDVGSVSSGGGSARAMGSGALGSTNDMGSLFDAMQSGQFEGGDIPEEGPSPVRQRGQHGRSQSEVPRMTQAVLSAAATTAAEEVASENRPKGAALPGVTTSSVVKQEAAPGRKLAAGLSGTVEQEVQGLIDETVSDED